MDFSRKSSCSSPQQPSCDPPRLQEEPHIPVDAKNALMRCVRQPARHKILRLIRDWTTRACVWQFMCPGRIGRKRSDLKGNQSSAKQRLQATDLTEVFRSQVFSFASSLLCPDTNRPAPKLPTHCQSGTQPMSSKSPAGVIMKAAARLRRSCGGEWNELDEELTRRSSIRAIP